ncbi:MAG: acetyl-CoA carboxylase biotin carboxylase subunit [Planctomycetota bacterium]|nr:acetyl-CoA carboxylase biotin carboxylase subunit [Planctomycetota bacterium]
MFRKVFIANRGEVAARMVRACRELGVESVCGVSDTDADAGFPYLAEATQRIRLGPGPAAQSYLAMENVVQAAVQTGCSALHPGWGFLAENARFAALCAQHGLTFIGPSPAAMDLMGGKVSSRAAAQAAGLPVVPGSEGVLADAAAAVRSADQVGYPVVLKADAGGGGRGIRRCANADELRTAFSEAAREAEAAFGNAALYLEKFLAGGRHIEFQVLGDGRGGAIHLGERECSIQRRHQKLLEEAPSPALSSEQRARMGEACARATAHWRYAGAGTMEFLLDADGALHFLEMNTRLQVEHPVTEAVTGLDLAQAQFRIAAGQGLPCTQSEVRWSGHAMEARINAEDPEDGFRPAPGTVKDFQIVGEGVRVDTHLAPGARISPFYDSLIAKVIAHGQDRAQAIDRLDSALAAACVSGVPTTLALHRRILAHADFRAGRFDTQWLERLLS